MMKCAAIRNCIGIRVNAMKKYIMSIMRNSKYMKNLMGLGHIINILRHFSVDKIVLKDIYNYERVMSGFTKII